METMTVRPLHLQLLPPIIPFGGLGTATGYLQAALASLCCFDWIWTGCARLPIAETRAIELRRPAAVTWNVKLVPSDRSPVSGAPWELKLGTGSYDLATTQGPNYEQVSLPHKVLAKYCSRNFVLSSLKSAGPTIRVLTSV